VDNPDKHDLCSIRQLTINTLFYYFPYSFFDFHNNQSDLEHRDHINKIESLLYKSADIHGMKPFGLILAPQPI
jgi:hypothetical protein